jgi:hypothetical protein
MRSATTGRTRGLQTDGGMSYTFDLGSKKEREFRSQKRQQLVKTEIYFRK